MKKFLFAIILGLAILVTNQVSALELQKGTDKVSVKLITNFNAINVHQNLEVLLKFTMHKGWHIYSQNPGDIGLPTKVNFELPLSYEQKENSWSVDEKFVTDGIEQYGYGKTAFYKTTIVPSKDVNNQAKIKVKVSWLACREECIPEKIDFSFNLPITEQDLQPTTTWVKNIQVAEHSFEARTQEMKVNLFLALIMAFLGGIILNFMPCIFPILTIKAISLAQSPYSRKKSRIEALLYTIGVVSSFLIIATALVILRAQGEQIGWGFQLQSPIFVSIMIVIFFVILLMLLDVVSVNNPFANRVGRISFKRQKINAFMTGFFAVLIASPCTAPFMGIAIGYTLTSPIYVYYPVFLALSLGYALPFAMAGLFPKVIHQILPRPGRWMDILKKFFAIPIFMTIVWLVWVLYSQVNTSKIVDLKAMEWKKYNASAIAELVAKKEPVFIDFTAKWCITCLMNKKIALQSESFAKIVMKKKIHLFQADWTNNDEVIATALERYGRNSIPLYVYYDGKSTNYKILPQLLSPGILEDYLQ